MLKKYSDEGSLVIHETIEIMQSCSDLKEFEYKFRMFAIKYYENKIQSTKKSATENLGMVFLDSLFCNLD